MSKRPTNDLFLLIRSMTAPEKRYFKQYHSRNIKGSGSSFIKLFDAINRQEEYDEKALVGSETYLSGFAQQKKHLYELIMRSLREYHTSSTPATRIRELVSNAGILKDKRLYKQSMDALSKAMKIAEETENYFAQVETGYRMDEIGFDT